MDRPDDTKFLLRVLNKILQDFGNPKFRRLSRTIPLVDAMASELEQIGFKEDSSSFLLPLGGEEQRVSLVSYRDKFQSIADSMLDPDSISLAQVAEILGRNGTLPGIDHSISDEPLGDVDALSNECTRPKKPWEID